jgi:5-methylcytosine-specific restriction endonuclease McrA
MQSLDGLTDHELIDRLRELVKTEQSLTIDILPHLAELEERQLYVGSGYGSLVDYCMSHLGYSESSAGRRVRAARVVGTVPEVYDLLKSEKLTFGGVLLLSGALRPENKTELLARVIGKTQGQIERIVAEYKPPKHIPDQARPTLVMKTVEPSANEAAGESSEAREPEPSPAALALGEPGELGDFTRQCDGSNHPPHSVLPAVELERMYEIRFAGDEELMELMAWMKTFLSGRYPKGASYLEMIKYAMTYVREREDLGKRAERRKQRDKNKKQKQPAKAASTSPESRHIPAREKETVWVRDQGRCTYVSPDGRRCNSTHNLQFDHHPISFARGGPSEANNLRLLCAKHNRYTAEQVYGKQHMERARGPN